jgi:hypothetical protein
MSHPALRLATDEPDQVPRLLAFRAAHPGVIIGAGEFGTWQALIRNRTARPSSAGIGSASCWTGSTS